MLVKKQVEWDAILEQIEINMEELITEIIVVIIVFLIFILNLIKVIKMYNNDYIVVKAKIKLHPYYVAGEHNPYYDHIMQYKINDKEYEKKFGLVFGGKEASYRKIIVNKIHGNIITTKLTRNILSFLLLINSVFPAIMICSFFEMIFDLLNF